jgi:hypothetical protein
LPQCESVLSCEGDDLEQLNRNSEVVQFPENRAVGNKIVEEDSSDLVPTKSDDDCYD